MTNSLKAIRRETKTAGQLKALRTKGLIPAVLYGGKNPNLKIGICGEHGGDPKSIEFFNDAKLDYVSCSPFRVPIARLAAAHCNK